MPFRVLPNGAIECDTLEEALSLQRASATKVRDNGEVNTSEKQGESGDEAYRNYWADLEDNGKKLLKILSDKDGEMVVTDDLATAFGVAPKDLPRTLIHVRKMGERYGIEPIKTKKKTVRGKFRTMYWMPRTVSTALKERLSRI